MIISERQAQWLASRDLQARSASGVDSIIQTYAGMPLPADLRVELAGMTDKTPEKVIAAARRFMDRIGEIQGMIGALVAAAKADPFFTPPIYSVGGELHTGLLLFHNEDVSIALGINGADMLARRKARSTGKGSVHFPGVWNLFRYVEAGDARITFWKAPRITAAFTAATAGQCEKLHQQQLKDGDEVLVDGAEETFILDHASSDILYLQAMVRVGATPVSAEYDAETRQLIGATGTDELAARVQMMATFLRSQDRDDAVPVLREFLNGPVFFSRWQVMRELLAMDAEAVYPDLRRMAAEDPHPEVRAAARQTLDMFFAEEEAALRESVGAAEGAA